EAQRVRRCDRRFDLDSFALRNFVSSSRPCPSGVRIITMSTWTLSSPLTRSTHGPSTGISPSIVMPSAVKKAIEAARSSTTTLTWSNLLTVISLAWQRPFAAAQADRSCEWTWLAEETQGDEGAARLEEGQMDVSPVLVADLHALVVPRASVLKQHCPLISRAPTAISC